MNHNSQHQELSDSQLDQRLSGLQSERPTQTDLWPGIQARLQQQPQQRLFDGRQTRPYGGRIVAVAAALTAAIGMLWIASSQPWQADTSLPVAARSGALQSGVGPSPAQVFAAELHAMQQQFNVREGNAMAANEQQLPPGIVAGMQENQAVIEGLKQLLNDATSGSQHSTHLLAQLADAERRQLRLLRFGMSRNA